MTNIAVIVLDTLRYDTFVKHFDWMDGVWFKNAWSTSHWTGPAHASILTGRYPSEINTTVKSRSLIDVPLITEELQSAGYNTQLVSTNLQIFVWDGWERGFDERFGPTSSAVDPVLEGVVDWKAFTVDTSTTGFVKYIRGVAECFRPRYQTVKSLREGYRLARGAGIPSQQAVANRLSTFETGDNEFLLANIMDMHAPYFPPKPYRSTNGKLKPELEDAFTGEISDADEIRQAYNDCARYLSDAYQSLHSDLLEDYDYVITLSDHGEHLGEDGLWSHSYGLRPELTHIGLVISGDGIDDNVVDTPVSLLDVHRTITELASIDIESHGQSLLDGLEPVDRLVEYHGLADKRRENMESRGIGGEFDWRDEPLDAIVGPEGYAYETHQHGLKVSGNWSIEEARDRLDALIKSTDRQPLQSDTTDTSGAIQRQLEALGYA